MTDTKVYRSVSQHNTYAQCPHRYYLERIRKVWQRPAAWLAQGSAVHEAIEAWEKSHRKMSLEAAQNVFRSSYERHINEAAEVTPNFEYWFASGPYRGAADIERRFNIGLEQVEKYLAWANSHPGERIWTVEGKPAIELEFDMTLGDVPVRGFIDAVVKLDGEYLVVRDHKTGNQPGDDFQLAVYALAIAEMYGVEAPEIGDYWMGKSGKATYPYDLTEWTKEAITERFVELDDNIKSERFDPNPSESACGFCPVRTSCDFAV